MCSQSVRVSVGWRSYCNPPLPQQSYPVSSAEKQLPCTSQDLEEPKEIEREEQHRHSKEEEDARHGDLWCKR